MDASTSWLPITKEQLAEHVRRANGFLAKTDWTPKAGVLGAASAEPAAAAAAGPRYRESSLANESVQSVSILKIARAVSRDEALLSEDVNHALHAVRLGLAIGMHMSKLYTESSGLDRLIDQNRRGGLDGPQKAEFRDKYHTAAAVATFTSAYYCVSELAAYKVEELADVRLDFQGVPELSLQNPVRAMQCMVFYYGAYLGQSNVVATDLDFVKMTELYFRGVIEEIKLREASLKHTELFTTRAYKLERSEFHVNGFEVDVSGGEDSVEFNRVELDQIVGNRDAKHGARRLVERLLCYDLESRRNPFVELGGFATIRLGHGKPGTGKSLQIAATATLLHDHARELGVPFLFWPMPDTVVSTFQGGSAERMVNWMRPLQDPTRIIYAPIDDGENNLEDRTRQGVSAGVREVIGVFLRYTEGAYAVNHGNAAIDIFTNLPDQLDKAVLSRIVARFGVDGAEKLEDFLDQDHLWWRRYQKIDPGFIDMADPKEYSYLAAQVFVKNLSEVYEGGGEPAEGRVRAIYDEVRKKHAPKEHAFFAELYRRVHREFPFFTSRDVRNVQQAVNERVMDFDLPDEWFEDHDLFFVRDYDTKRSMLVELMRRNMRGFSFAEIRLQETVRYLDNMVRIANVTRERRIDEAVEDALLQREVARRLAERQGRPS